MSTERERGTTYRAGVTLAGGVEVDVSIFVPVSAAYPDQPELAECVQRAAHNVVSDLARSPNITVDRPRSADPFLEPHKVDPWAAPEGRRRADGPAVIKGTRLDVDTPGQGV